MHWTRKTIYTFLTIFILSYFLYFYVQNIFLPVQFKRFVIVKAQEYLHRNVAIDEIHFNPLRGFIVRNLIVYQKDAPDRVFLQADEIAFHVLLAPIFRKKILLIPSIRVSGPFIQITREDQNRWNFSDLMEDGKSPEGKSSWTVAPRKIIILDGEIAYTDRTVPENFQEVISGINLDARFSLNKIIRFTLEGKIPRRGSAVSIKGNYYIEARKLSCRALGQNIPLAQYLALTPLPAGTRVAEGLLTALDINLNWEPRALQAQGTVTLDKMTVDLADGKRIAASARATDVFLTRQDGRWKASGHLESPATRVALNDGRSFDGKINADIKSLDVSPEGVSAQGTLALTDAQIVTGENKTIRAQTFQADNFIARSDERGIHLQTALNISGLDAVFSDDHKLRGNLTTRKTELTSDKDKFGISSDLQLTSGRLDFQPEQYLQADFKSSKTLLVCSQTNKVREQSGCEIKTDLGLGNAHLQLTPQIALEGHPDGDLTCRYDPNGQENKYLYSGVLHFSDGVIKDVPYLHSIERIRGTIQIETDHLASDGLAFQTQGTDVELTGSLANFSRPVLNVQAKTNNLDLQKLFAAFPVLTEKTTITPGVPGVPGGTAAVEVSYVGDIRSPAAADIRINTKFQNATITSPKIPDNITDITGEIDYQKDMVVWKDLQGLYQKKRYTLNGRFADFSRPVLDVQVASQDLNASAQIKILNRAFQIISLTGKYLDSSLDVKGDVHLPEGNEPNLDIRGAFVLDLGDLPAFSDALKEHLAKLQPAGTLTGEGLFKGKPNQWRDWNLTFTARAPTISFNGFSLDDPVIEYEQRDRHVSKCNLTGRVYNGNLNIISSADLTQEDAVAQLTGSLEALDLAVLRERKLSPKGSLSSGNEFLAGRLSALVNLNGDLNAPARWAGGGSVSVTDGHLLRWDILDGLLGALLIPEFKEVVFTDGQADFAVTEGKITTADATLDSSTVRLKGKGWIDLEGNINFDITPTFGELVAAESGSLKKIPSLLLAQSEDYLTVKLTGTLGNPKYKIQTLPFKILEKTTDVLRDGLKEGIGNILKEIF